VTARAPETEVTTADGWRLSARVLRAEPRHGIALLLPAMMTDARTLDRPPGRGFGSHLAERGWETWLADFRGHGRSGPSPRTGATWGYDDLVRFDVPALVAAARAEAGRLPVVVLGHSLGGHVTVAAVATGASPPPDAIVGLSCAVWDRRLAGRRRTRWRRSLVMLAFEATARARGRFPARRLRIGNADEPTPYVADLARFQRTRWGSRDGVDYLAAMRDLPCPVLGVYAKGDRMLRPLSTARAWLAHAPRHDLLEVGGGAAHVSHVPGHMDLVTDPACRPAWDHVVAWMDRLGR
jgi:predicted alpha/beta hydrolase